MTTKFYNGFSPKERHDASLWARGERAAGRLPPHPKACMVCAQADGRLEGHSEDYGAPYGAHVGAYFFCFWCHRMLHARFSSPAAWANYLAALREGLTFDPIRSNSYAEITPYLRGRRAFGSRGPARTELLFDVMDLSASPTEPPRTLLLRRASPVKIAQPPPQLSLFTV